MKFMKIFLILFLFSSSNAFASKAVCKDIVKVDVNGLVCDFCARAIEKVFRKKAEVSNIDVNLNEGEILIAMKNGQTINDSILTKLITDSGYDVVKINRGCDE